MDDTGKQIVDSIKKSSNILVTVSNNPSVDELSAALALSIILNNMDKRTSAVFSGEIPPAITFLEPDRTFEHSADSLRDFIIALNKEKADHLRYKVDGDVVKIFITPYKTTLTEKDLEFSQGDYNVELVLALGVTDQEHLDKALAAHGKILHDATVITITAGTSKSNLGSIDWHNADTSSLSEMIVALADGLKGDEPILDQQIATALLTGIVSATDRFSNSRTTSRAMTMAAQLMAAGANQQLIATKLEEAHEIVSKPPKPSAPDSETSSAPVEEKEKPEEPSNELTIDRSEDTTEPKLQEEKAEPSDGTSVSPEAELEKHLADITVPPTDTLADIEKELQQPSTQQPSLETQAEVASVPEQPVAEPAQPPIDLEMSGMPTVQPLPPSAPESVPEPAPEPVPAPEPTPQFPVEPPQIVNDHGGKFAPNPDGNVPQINSIQNNPNDGEPTIDPFNVPSPSQTDVPAMPNANIGTPEGAALLASEPDMATVSLPQTPPMPPTAPMFPPPPPIQPASAPVTTMPQLPPLPPLPTTNLPPLPPPPPPPPTPPLGQAPSDVMPAGAVSGDVFGDTSGAMSTPATPPPPPEPGQFRIPGQN